MGLCICMVAWFALIFFQVSIISSFKKLQLRCKMSSIEHKNFVKHYDKCIRKNNKIKSIKTYKFVRNTRFCFAK